MRDEMGMAKAVIIGSWIDKFIFKKTSVYSPTPIFRKFGKCIEVHLKT